MSDVALIRCTGLCRRELPATLEYFVANKTAKNGLRSECKHCYSDRRKVKKSPEIKALERLDQMLKDAHAAVSDPSTKFTERHKADQTIRNYEKRRQKLMEPIEAQRKELETAQRLAEVNPSLARVKAQFYYSPFAISHSDESDMFTPSPLTQTQFAQMVVEMKSALVELIGPADEPAREYLTKLIAHVEEVAIEQAAAAKEKADAEQDQANLWAIQRAIGNIHDEWLPKIRAAKTVTARDVLRKQIWALKRGALEVATKSTERDDAGAQLAVVASALAKEFDKLAHWLYGKDDKPRNETDTLENIQSRIDQANASVEWQEKAEADRQKYWADLKQNDPKRFERESRSLELQIRGDGPLADLQRKSVRELRRSNPREYERRALEALKPRKISQDVIVYVVTTPEGVQWLWPDGRPVRHGGDVQHSEVIKDALHGWVLSPEPASAETDISSSVKQELIQEDDGSWKWIPEGSRGTFEQQNDGTWKQKGGGVSPWGKATPIVFRNAEPHLEGSGRDFFRYGSWWTLAEIQKATDVESETPPMVLPPLQRVVADSIAVEPPPNAIQLERMNRPAETPWQRHERKQRQEKEAEQAMLRGVFKWNFNSSAAIKTA
jgi:hypothetical protein